jgi:predicted metal-dependent peptidase
MSFPKHLEQKIFKARFELYAKHPFFAQIAQYLKPQICNDIPTLGVTANSDLLINEEFFSKLNHQDTVWVIAHEAMHMVTMTHGRMPEGVYHSIWNIASDACINYIITDDAEIPIIRYDVLGGKPIYGDQWAKYKDSTTEAVYYDICKDAEQQLGMSLEKFLEEYEGDGEGGAASGNGSKGKMKDRWWDDTASRLGKKGNSQGTDQNGNAKSDGGMTEEQKSQWKQRIASAAAAAKQAGKMSGALDQYVTTLLQPKKDWKRELRSLAMTAIRTQWTWKLPSRRTSGKIRTPGKDRGTPTAICYIDTSGSMSDQELQRCLSETSKIFKICGGNGHLILGDSEIYYSGVVDAAELGSLKEVRRGGTDFTVLFDHIEETFQKRPALLVGFTDLCGPFPKNPPAFPVIWCRPKSGYAGHAPWGRLIEVEL